MRSYFSVFGDIAKMWTDLSARYVLPGLRMCDDVAITASEDPGAMQKKVKTLEAWAKDASENVGKIAGEVKLPDL